MKSRMFKKLALFVGLWPICFELNGMKDALKKQESRSEKGGYNSLSAKELDILSQKICW